MFPSASPNGAGLPSKLRDEQPDARNIQRQGVQSFGQHVDRQRAFDPRAARLNRAFVFGRKHGRLVRILLRRRAAGLREQLQELAASHEHPLRLAFEHDVELIEGNEDLANPLAETGRG